jgi:hypothetical protein
MISRSSCLLSRSPPPPVIKFETDQKSVDSVQTQLDNLKAVIQSHAIPATAVQTFSADVIRSLINVYNHIDHDGNGFVSDEEVIRKYYAIRKALRLPDKKCDIIPIKKKLKEMDFSGDGTVDLREFLFFATYIQQIEEDE